MSERDIDALLRANLAAADLPSERVAAIRSQARDQLRRATGRAERRRRAWRTIEAGAALALGAVQITWAVIRFLDRPY